MGFVIDPTRITYTQLAHLDTANEACRDAPAIPVCDINNPDPETRTGLPTGVAGPTGLIGPPMVLEPTLRSMRTMFEYCNAWT